MTLHTECYQGSEFATVIGVERPSFEEVYITTDFSSFDATERTIASVYDDIRNLLHGRGIEVISEKVFGLREFKSEFDSMRIATHERLGINPEPCYTYLQGTPLVSSPMAGMQFWGIIPYAPGTSVETFEVGETAAGRVFNGPGFRLHYFPGISGACFGESGAASVTEQGHAMFTAAEAALAARRMTFRNTLRTWIYMARLLDWYGEFNHIRTQYYAEHGLFSSASGPWLPASTGIQAQSENEECIMDLLAMDRDYASGAVSVESITSTKRQNRAFSYGSAFSRAVALTAEGRSTLYISGTASIDGHGRTIHLNDPEAQCFQMLMSVAAILEDAGGTLNDICSATLFCKNRDVYDAYLRVCQGLQLPSIPMVRVKADVCRYDLLVEMDAVAVV